MSDVAAPAGRLTTGDLRPTILRLAAPTVAMMAFNTGFNVIDSIWVGRLIGPAALAAVSTAGFTVVTPGGMVAVFTTLKDFGCERL